MKTAKLGHVVTVENKNRFPNSSYELNVIHVRENGVIVELMMTHSELSRAKGRASKNAEDSLQVIDGEALARSYLIDAEVRGESLQRIIDWHQLPFWKRWTTPKPKEAA